MTADLDWRARLLREAAERAGWSDAEAIVERVRGLQRGGPAEDELSVILSWLGRCRLVHKLDQQQYPEIGECPFRVPDLLAVFEYAGRILPVLIEVKRTDKRKLKWRPDYIAGLQNYADAVGLPLLIAWKCLGLWVLFEPRHMKLSTTNLHIAFTDAMPNTLMCQLAGDFSFSLHAGVGVHLQWRRLTQTGPSSWHMQLERAGRTQQTLRGRSTYRRLALQRFWRASRMCRRRTTAKRI